MDKWSDMKWNEDEDEKEMRMKKKYVKIRD
jgi:hypothetical protein